VILQKVKTFSTAVMIHSKARYFRNGSVRKNNN